eukprot:TRINITY_DN4457_c0_g1_i1.p1 TRINITY_DN4457_c0_g1~~TRINITY_DN4457_c0_g1_i1.p1  ORF type:complete len:585 (+),score=101.94 TRINITY_DN4457_c0_g1_i1:74-1828(+)
MPALASCVVAPDAAASATVPWRHCSISSLWGINDVAVSVSRSHAVLAELNQRLEQQGLGTSSLPRSPGNRRSLPARTSCSAGSVADFDVTLPAMPPPPQDVPVAPSPPPAEPQQRQQPSLKSPLAAVAQQGAAAAADFITLTAVGGGELSDERWYPPAPSASQIAACGVIDWTRQQRAEPGALSAAYEQTVGPRQGGSSPLGSPVSVSPTAPVGGIRASMRRPQQSLRTQLLQSAPWHGGPSASQVPPASQRRPAPLAGPAAGAPAPPPVSPVSASVPDSAGDYVPGRPAAQLQPGDGPVWDLRGRGLGAADCASVAQRLREAPHLTLLDLSENPHLADGGLRSLQIALAAHPSLTSVNLAGLLLGDADVIGMADVLKANETITELDLRWNGITHSGAQILKKLIDPDQMSALRFLHLGADHMRFETQYEGKGSTLGFTVNETCMICSISEGTSAAAARAIAGQRAASSTVGARLIPGMTVRAVNGSRVRTREDIQKELKRCKPGVLQFKVQSNRVPPRDQQRVEEKLRLAQKRSTPLSPAQARSRSARIADAMPSPRRHCAHAGHWLCHGSRPPPQRGFASAP